MKKGINVLSMFDGMSCGQLALKRRGIKVNTYNASEVDKYSMSVAQRNFPETNQIGDAQKVKAKKYRELGIDILMGGSPCQNFSFAGKQNGMSGSKKGKKKKVEILTLKKYLKLKKQGFEFEGQSYLFWEFVRMLKKVKPKYFLLENVMMTQKWQDVISEALGVEPVEINSNLVSAQNRRRLYWTNIPNVGQPLDKGIYLEDILESDGFGVIKSHGEWKARIIKSQCLDANYFKGVDNHGQRTMVAINYSSSGRGENGVEDRSYLHPKKAHALCAGGYSTRSFTGVVDVQKEDVRKLTPLECERLQTVPEGYTEGVSNSQRYKMLGNGWTIDAIAHIFKNLPYEQKKKKKLIKRY